MNSRDLLSYLIYGLSLFQLSMSPLFQLPCGVAPDGRRGAMQQPDGQCDARRGTSRQQVSVALRERPGSGLRGTHRGTSEVLRYGQRKTKNFYPYPRTTAVIDHRITTRRAGAESMKRVDVVQMEAGSAVARSSSRAARPCAVDAAPPRYPHVREEAPRSGLQIRESGTQEGRQARGGGGQGEGLGLEP